MSLFAPRSPLIASISFLLDRSYSTILIHKNTICYDCTRTNYRNTRTITNYTYRNTIFCAARPILIVCYAHLVLRWKNNTKKIFMRNISIYCDYSLLKSLKSATPASFRILNLRMTIEPRLNCQRIQSTVRDFGSKCL